jgi:transposase
MHGTMDADINGARNIATRAGLGWALVKLLPLES